MRSPRALIAACLFPAMAVANPAPGQNFPNKPVRIVATEPGGTGDLVARTLAQGLTASLGQQVIVDNRGGNVAIPAEVVSKSPPDGHTVLFFGSAFWLLPFMRDNAPYDPVRDFSPLTLVTTAPIIVVVPTSSPVNSVADLIALARSRPAQLNYGTTGTGSANHLAAELFQAMAGVQLVRINYKGVAPAINDLIAGQVQLSFTNAAAGMPHVKSGRLRALAVTSSKASVLAPGLPTIAASGLPGYESISILGMFAPARTPEAVMNRLNQEIVQVLNRAEVKERFINAGVEAVGSSSQQFAATVKFEMARMGRIIKDAGIRSE